MNKVRLCIQVKEISFLLGSALEIDLEASNKQGLDPELSRGITYLIWG